MPTKVYDRANEMTIVVRMPKQDHKRLKHLAIDKDTTMEEVVRNALKSVGLIGKAQATATP